MLVNGQVVEVVEEAREMNNKNRRLALLISGVADTLIGTAFLLVGFDFININIGIPSIIIILIGGVMLVAGIAVAVYNLSRWEE